MACIDAAKAWVRRSLRNGIYGIASTAISGLSNVAIQLLVAALTSSADFGQFSLISTTILFMLGLGRAVVGQNDMLRGSAKRDESVIRTAYEMAGVVLVAGAFVTFVGVVSNMWLIAQIGIAVLLSSVFILQDTMRFRCFRTGKARSALVSDASVLLLAVLGMILASSAGLLVTYAPWIWAIATFVGFGVIAVPIRYFPTKRTGRSWLLVHRDLIGPSSAEYLMQAGLPYVVNWILVLTGGYVALAGYRLIQLLFAAVSNFAQGINAVLLPPIVNENSPQLAVKRTSIEALALLLASAALFLLIWLVPEAWGVVVFGSTWLALAPFILPGSMHGTANALAVSNYSMLRLLGFAKFSLVIRVWSVVTSVLAVLVGIVVLGPPGAAWGMAVVAVFAYLVRVFKSRFELRKLIRNGDRFPVGGYLK